ncbi:hypothetical protein [Chishuiella sp.]|uniref:hypothetical protein n=1 Tax=Chishuiella sp. TaxID=1969467 RepID=UPI0028B1B098|nr:hypothetical protein [Chishuiella sp.]
MGIIIGIIVIVLFLIYKNKTDKTKSSNNTIYKKNEILDNLEEEYDKYDTTLGKAYKEITVKRKYNRNTFIEGYFTSKYRGGICNKKDDKKDFRIKLYIVEITLTNSKICNCIIGNKSICNGIHLDKEKNFITDKSNLFNIDEIQLPEEYTLNGFDNEIYKIKLKDPKIFNFESLRQFHQSEDDEVFGVINGQINGHLLDYTYQDEIIRKYEPSIYERSEYTTPYTSISGTKFIDLKDNIIENEFDIPNQKILKNNKEQLKINTGKTSIKKTIRKSYNNKYLNGELGCSSILLWLLILIISTIITFSLIPQLSFIVIIFAIIFGLYLLPTKFGNWLLSALYIFYAFFIIAALTFPVWKKGININWDWIRFPKYTIQDEVIKENPIPIIETVIENQKIKDHIIVNHKTWEDYNGNVYDGTYNVKLSDLRQSRSYKYNLHLRNITSYNQAIHLLKENDQNRLNGVYEMFDSIRNHKNLNQIDFANMIISFIQDFKYNLILPKACDPKIYNDDFISNYLNNNEGPCYPNQPFGINTPVEFIANSIADCDTRTLAIYTILSHYNYDVVILSSDYYGHSLFGINLPYIAKYKYPYHEKQYTIFETTVAKSVPGAISNEISNLNHWKITLMSK